MKECEKVIVNQLIESNIVEFYIRYVNDTLLVLRKKDIDVVLTLMSFNSFNKQFKIYSWYSWKLCAPLSGHNICPNRLIICHENTQTGQYTNIQFFTLWKRKTLWITLLTIRAKQICSQNYLNQEINQIKDYIALIGFPKRIANSIIKWALQSNGGNTTLKKLMQIQ